MCIVTDIDIVGASGGAVSEGELNTSVMYVWQYCCKLRFCNFVSAFDIALIKEK